MSHHYSGPNIGFPRGDARLDLTDLYAFPKKGDDGKSILIMNVHPSVGLNPRGPTTAEPFAPEARYELKIDTDGDPATPPVSTSNLFNGAAGTSWDNVTRQTAALTGVAKDVTLRAHAEDAAGNVEKTPHVMTWRR